MKLILALIIASLTLIGCSGGAEPQTDTKLEPANGRVAEQTPTPGAAPVGGGASDVGMARQQGGGNKEAAGGK